MRGALQLLNRAGDHVVDDDFRRLDGLWNVPESAYLLWVYQSCTDINHGSNSAHDYRELVNVKVTLEDVARQLSSAGQILDLSLPVVLPAHHEWSCVSMMRIRSRPG